MEAQSRLSLLSQRCCVAKGMEGTGGGKVFNKLRMTVFPKWYVYNHANPVEAGTAYEILPGSVAANATAWGCQGEDCPSTKGKGVTDYSLAFIVGVTQLVI